MNLCLQWRFWTIGEGYSAIVARKNSYMRCVAESQERDWLCRGVPPWARPGSRGKGAHTEERPYSFVTSPQSRLFSSILTSRTFVPVAPIVIASSSCSKKLYESLLSRKE